MTTLKRASLFLLLACVTCDLASAGPTLDDLFVKVFSEDAFVLQGNFASEHPPLIRARLFGKTDSSSSFPIKFQSSSPYAYLNGRALFENAVEIDITPEADASGWRWSWSGAFGCTTNTADIQIWIGTNAPVTAKLGEVWVIAGGENTSTSAELTAPDKDGYRVTAVQPSRGLPIIVAQEDKTANAPFTAPILAWKFASGLSQKLKRPIAVHTISAKQASHLRWRGTNSVWRPLFGTDDLQATSLMITVRGIVWWRGEWDAEYGAFPDPTPSDDAATPNGWTSALKNWKEFHRRMLIETMRDFVAKISTAVVPVETDLSKIPLYSLVIQLQGIDRQPRHSALLSASTNAVSAWELFRAAQTEAVTAFGSHAALIPAVHSITHEFPARWFWERNDIERISTNIVAAAYRQMTVPAAQRIGPPTPDWSDSNTVKVRFNGTPKNKTENNILSAGLEFATRDRCDVWKPFQLNFGADVTTIEEAGHTIVAVRYAAGDSPKALHLLDDANQPIGAIPVFEFFRP